MCMINNLKTSNITLIPTPFRGTEIFKNVGGFVPKEMLINTCVLKNAHWFHQYDSSTANACRLAEKQHATLRKRIRNEIFRTK